jgi:GTP-binding protein
MKMPKVVIVGRTNVGKSTIFNKLIEEQKSLVSEVPGTTRDIFEADCIWRGRVFSLLDTGGLDRGTNSDLDILIGKQSRKAIKESDVIVFVVDAQTGLQEEDRNLANEMRKFNKPIILVANKADNKVLQSSTYDPDWKKWELKNPFPISAKRGTGTGDLLDMIYFKLEEIGMPAVSIIDIKATRVSVIGRPNVGKSSLLNAALGENRFIASEKEHTTREPNDTRVNVGDRNYVMIDTAGMRKMAKVKASSKLEKEGVDRSIRAMKQSDVCLLVLDVSQVIHAQDKHLAGELANSGASVIIIANKWDLVEDKDPVTINKYEKYIRANLPMLDWAPILFTTAKTGKRVHEMFKLIDVVVENRFTQLNDQEAYEFMSRAIARHKPSRGKGVSHPQIARFRQTRINPPMFELTLKQSHIQALNSSYLRFLENLLREHYAFDGTPIKMSVKGRKKSHIT